MSSGSPLHISSKSTLEFKSSSFDVPALVLGSNKITIIKKELQEKISQAPEFFKQSPVVIDIHELTELQLNIDIRTLIQTLRDLKFFPIGVQGGSDKQHKIAVDSGVPILSLRLFEAAQTPEPEKPKESELTEPSETAPTDTETTETSSTETTEETNNMDEPVKKEDILEKIETEVIAESMLITEPVRSGQRIYSKGDLTILAQVSSGAEVIAEGNIHVYAPLRGRALAGVQGNTESRIFCSDLRAELVSIAGNYRIKDDIKEDTGNKSMQIFLKENALIIEEL